MPKGSVIIKRSLNRCTFAATRLIHWVAPTLPVLDKWPGTAECMGAVYRRLFAPAHERFMAWAAERHRRRLKRMIVIGITGSGGKTTAKNILASILARRFTVHWGGGTGNAPRDVARIMLRARRSNEVCLIELSGGKPGILDGPLGIIKPNYAIVTNVGTDHYGAFHSIDAIAEEKGKLVAVIPPDGVAVLNTDDPRVLAMSSRCAGRVITYGCSADAMLRARDVAASWPDRLSFTATWHGDSARVQTQLLGKYWTSTVLAAMAAAIAMGVPLPEAAAAVATVPPFKGRMSPVELQGITFIRDDWKASRWTIPAALDFLREARAGRKVLVIGTISDTFGTAGTIYAATAKEATTAADHVVFIGPRSFAALRAKNDSKDRRLLAFSSVKAASDHLRDFLRPGDLVLLKGSNPADHLQRLILACTGDISCWRSDCGKEVFCDICPWRLVASEEEPSSAAPNQATPAADLPTVAPASLDGPRVVVGFGNPGRRYQGTPHNVGHAVLDRLAVLLGVTWTSQHGIVLGFTEKDGRTLCLVKPGTYVNLMGRALKELADRLGFEPRDCILVHDDLDLPLGTVRARMRGSDGGHRGVRSVLEAFQTDQFPRVKVGVREEGPRQPPAEYVLRPFSPSAAMVLDQACAEAAERILWLLSTDSGTAGSKVKKPS